MSIFFILFFCISNSISAPKLDHKGTDFWLAFPPNYHNNIYSQHDAFRKGDSLYIFIFADEPTSGKIDYKDRNGNEYTEEFTINEQNVSYTFKVSFGNFEVSGFNKSGDILSLNDTNNQSEKVGVNSFHITSDNDISVIAHSQAVTTADGFLVLPTDVLGKEYLILSYNSDGWSEWDEITGHSTPSQFLIVATEDSTNIQINSQTAFYRNNTNPIKINLKQGEVFLVQAKITEQILKPDLTGTEIISNKPISVISGHQRVNIPNEITSMSSRDYLVEQLLPINSCGKNTFIVPYIQPEGVTTSGNDLFRVLFSEDKTDLYINGYYEGRFSRGEYVEMEINGAMSLEATYPILVAQYKKTSQGPGALRNPPGDPFMTLMQSKEHFLSEYEIKSIQTYQMDNSNGFPNGQFSKAYSNHYVAIVADSIDIEGISIDDSLVSREEFLAIPNSEYYYANIEVEEGTHKVKGNHPFGLSAYGWGYACSYGYPAGFNFEGIIIDVDDKKEITLNQKMINYPNPVNNTTNIEFELLNDSDLEITIYSVLGEIKLNYKLGFFNKGVHQIGIDMEDFSAGTYLYLIKTNSSLIRGKLIKQ